MRWPVTMLIPNRALSSPMAADAGNRTASPPNKPSRAQRIEQQHLRLSQERRHGKAVRPIRQRGEQFEAPIGATPPIEASSHNTEQRPFNLCHDPISLPI
jgi:hypothetical protein